jgi:acetyltransferase-like isoleucine patch superfamily enzyme
MASSITRIFQRYFVPSLFKSLYFYLKYGTLVSTKARVQLTSKISFGKGTVVKPFAVIQSTSGKISIGKNCAISSFNHLSTGEKDMVIGNNVRLGPHVTIVATTRNFENKSTLIVDQGYSDKGIIIGDDVLIGAGAIILDGCQIGEGVVVGAGSVVTSNIPAYKIVVGSPAKEIGERR